MQFRFGEFELDGLTEVRERVLAPFVGRQSVLAELDSALDAAREGDGRVAMVAGDAGIGKTRMLHEFRDRARARGVRVLSGWCDERQGMSAYRLWTQILRRVFEERTLKSFESLGSKALYLAQIIPELREQVAHLEDVNALSPEQARFQVFDGVAEVFRQYCRESITVLILDDLQWADLSSLLLLEFMVHELASERLFVVGAYRSEELTGEFPLARTQLELARAPGYLRVVLKGLTVNETAELATILGRPDLSRTLTEEIWKKTEGNPFFVTKIIDRLEAVRGSNSG